MIFFFSFLALNFSRAVKMIIITVVVATATAASTHTKSTTDPCTGPCTGGDTQEPFLFQEVTTRTILMLQERGTPAATDHTLLDQWPWVDQCLDLDTLLDQCMGRDMGRDTQGATLQFQLSSNRPVAGLTEDLDRTKAVQVAV
jgi:hypothetical protein